MGQGCVIWPNPLSANVKSTVPSHKVRSLNHVVSLNSGCFSYPSVPLFMIISCNKNIETDPTETLNLFLE